MRTKAENGETTRKIAWGLIAYILVMVWGAVFVDVSEDVSVAIVVTGVLWAMVGFTYWLFSW